MSKKMSYAEFIKKNGYSKEKEPESSGVIERLNEKAKSERNKKATIEPDVYDSKSKTSNRAEVKTDSNTVNPSTVERAAARKAATRNNTEQRFTQPGNNGQLPGAVRNTKNDVSLDIITDVKKRTEDFIDLNKSVINDDYNSSNDKKKNDKAVDNTVYSSAPRVGMPEFNRASDMKMDAELRGVAEKTKGMSDEERKRFLTEEAQKRSRTTSNADIVLLQNQRREQRDWEQEKADYLYQKENGWLKENDATTQKYIDKFYSMSEDERKLIANIYADIEVDHGKRDLKAKNKYTSSINKLKFEYGYSDDDIDAMRYFYGRYINKRNAKTDDINARLAMEKHPFLESIASVPMGLAGGVMAAGGILDSYVDNKMVKKIGIQDQGIDYNHQFSKLQRQSQSGRDEFTKTHDFMIGGYDVGDMLYNTALSGVESMASAFVPGGAALLAVNAGTSKINELSQRGLSSEKAIVGGVAAAAAEFLFEKISIGNFKKMQEVQPDTIMDVVKNLAKSMGVNASEEALTETANILFDTFVNGELSDYQMQVDNLVNSGEMSRAEAEKKVRNGLIGQVVEAAVSGAIMGAGFSAVTTVPNYMGRSAAITQLGAQARQKGMTQQVIAEAQAAPNGSKANKTFKNSVRIHDDSGKYKLDNKGKYVSDYKLGLMAVQSNDFANSDKGRFSNVETQAELDERYQSAMQMKKDKGSDSAKQIKKEYEQTQARIRMKNAAEGAKPTGYKKTDVLTRVEITNPTVKVDGKEYTAQGKNVDTKTGEISDAQTVFKDADGDNAIRFGDGKTMKVSEAVKHMTDKTAKEVYKATEGMSAEAANLFVSNYDGDDIGDYTRAFKYVSDMGRTGLSATQIREYNPAFGNYFTTQAQEQIAAEGLKNREFSAGVTELTFARSTKQFKQTVQLIDQYAKESGLEVIILNENTRVNGYHLQGTNRIVLYANVGGKENLMTRTFGHETFHFISENSSEEADKLRNYVVEALKKNGVDIEAELTKYGNIKDDNGNLVYSTRETQIDELVADSMFDVFTNKAAIDRLAKNDRSLAQKIADKFKEILNVIRTKLKMMGETSKNNPEIKALMNDAESLEQIVNKFHDALDVAKNNFNVQDSGKDAGKNFSFAAAARTRPDVITEAENMEKDGATQDEIWKKLGLIRDASGIWVYEIDDSGMKIYPNGDALIKKEKGYQRMMEIFNKAFVNGEQLTESEQKEYSELDKKYKLEKKKAWKLEDFVEHDELFHNYPQLRNAGFEFVDLGSGKAGTYDPKTNTIYISESRKNSLHSLSGTAIHEIQHAIQHIDNRANGTSPEYWKKKIADKSRDMAEKINEKKIESIEYLNSLDNELRSRIREINRADTSSAVGEKSEYDVLKEQLLKDDKTGAYKKYLEMSADIDQMTTEWKNYLDSADSLQMYRDTAGEIEARESASRLKMTAEERTEKMPDLGQERAVFAEESKISFDVATDNNGNKVVVMFDNVLKNTNSNIHQSIANNIAQNIGKYYRIIESGQKVYIGKDLPGEYTQSEYTKNLIKNHRRKILRAKHQAIQNFGEMIEIATNRRWEENKKQKHKKDAKYGWYRYTTRFAVPKYDSFGNGNGFNVFSADLLIRNDANGKKYLYDILNINEEKSSSLPTSWISKIRNNSSTSLDTSISQSNTGVNNDFMQDSQDDALKNNLSIDKNSAIDAHYGEVIKELNQWRVIGDLLTEEGIQHTNKDFMLNSRDIHRISKNIITKTKSKYDLATLENQLTAVFEYIKASGKHVDSAEVSEVLYKLSHDVLSQSEMRDTELYEQYSEVRKILHDTQVYIPENVRKEIASQFGDFKSFRNLLMGKMMHITTTDSNARSLDEVWQELSEMAPEYFPKDTNELDMPMQLTRFFEIIAPKTVNPYEHYEMNIADEAAVLANDIFTDYTKIKLEKTDSGKAKDILNAGMRKLSESKKEMIAEFDRKKLQNADEYRARLAEYRQQRQDADRRRVNRNEIERNYNYLNRRLARETDSDRILEQYKPLATAFRAIVPDSNSRFSRKALTDFENEYRKIEDMSTFYDAGIAEMISKFKEYVTSADAPRMRDLDNFELGMLRDITQHVKYVIQNENRLFSEGLNGRIEDFGKQVHSELENKKESKAQGIPERGATIKDRAVHKIDSFIKGLVKPEYLFESLGSETMKSLYDELRKGENTEAKIIYDAKLAETEIKKKNNYDSRWVRQNVTLDLRSGKRTMTVEDVMSLYATSRRQQGLEHMLNGGAVVYTKKELIKKNGKTKDMSKTERIVFAVEDIALIEKTLTKDQKNYVNEMVEYITKTIGEKRNEISMKLYGIEKYKESYYFPISVDGNFVDTSVGRQEVVSTIKNQSSSKRTVDHAKNPIEISGFTDTVNSHIFDSALYCSYVLPINDFKRVFNFRDKVFEGEGTESLIAREISVKDDIKRTSGVNAIDEIKRFMVALDSGSRYENLMPVSAQLMARTKKAAVMANLSVVVQQPTAVFRAMLYVNPKYFTTWAKKTDIEEMKRWNGCALKKEIGYFDVNMGRSATDYMNEYDTDKSIKKDWSLKDKFNNSNGRLKLDQAAGFLASKADEKTWGAIWKACKKQVKSENPSLSGDSLNSAAAELFQTTISKTQVYDSVFTKPEFMRRKEGFALMATQFMSEPLTSLNMLAEAVSKQKNAEKNSQQRNDARKFTARAFGCFATSLVVNSALKSLIYTMRDDDENTFLEKYIANFTEGIVTDTIGMIPYVKDVLSIVQGYDLERADVAVFTTFAEAIKGLGNDNKSTFDKIMGVMKAAGQASGIPAYNVVRDAKAIIDIVSKIVDGIQNGFPETTGRGVLNELRDVFDWVPGINAQTNYEQLYDSIVKGDKKHYERVYNSLVADDKSKSSIEDGIGKVMAEKNPVLAEAFNLILADKTVEASEKIQELKNAGFSNEVINNALSTYKTNLKNDLVENEEESEDNRIKQAAFARYDMDYTLYESLVNELIADGYNETIVREAIDSEKVELEKAASDFSLNEKDEYTATYDMRNALQKNNFDNFESVYKEIAENSGESEAKKNAKSEIKKAYKDGHISEGKAGELLKEYVDSDYSDTDVWKELYKAKSSRNSIYDKMYDAIDNGGNFSIDYLLEQGIEKDDIAGQIATYAKPKLLEMEVDSKEYNEMYENILDAYVTVGKTEAYGASRIRKWHSDAAKAERKKNMLK